jgi:hypothetical protein
MSLTPIAFLYGIPILLVMAAIVVAIVLVVMRLARNPARQAQAPATPVAPVTPMAATGALQWNAHVRRDGHLDAFSGFGTLTLANGVLTFVPDDAPDAGWAYPAVSFGIRVNFVLANSDLMVDSAGTGRLQVTVSHEHINRMSRNNVKTLRERDTSGEFIQAMRAAGATILS